MWRDLLRNKVVVVAAAGNHGRQDAVKGVGQNNRPGLPAACDGVIAVGSVGRNGAPSDFNPRDAEWIDLFELGEQVLSTSVCGGVKYTVPMGCIEPPSNPVVFEGTAQWTGTSFAATTVAGKIAATMIATEQSAFDAVGELTGGREV